MFLTRFQFYVGRITDFITNFEDVTIKNDNKDPLWGKKKYMTALVSSSKSLESDFLEA